MTARSIAFLFPGQGSQTAGMGKDLAESFPEFKRTFEEASDALGFNMGSLCFEDPEKQLGLTEFTQPALLAMSTGVARILAARSDTAFTLVAGHSLGEYSALVAAGALEFAQALKAVRFRGQAMQRAVPIGVGAMTAYLGGNVERVLALCEQESVQGESVQIVNFNAKTQAVLSGHKEAVARVAKAIAAEKLGKAMPLPVSAPFHSTLMAPAAREMAGYLEHVALGAVRGKIVANVDARTYTGSQYAKDLLVRQVASPVLWTQTLAELKETHAPELWVEVGPGGVMQSLLKKTLEGCEAMGTSDVAAVEGVMKRLA